MLRDPNGNLRCPFGADFETQSCTESRLDRSHRIPFWLALMELYSDGYRYDCHSDKNLPPLFQEVVELLLTKRQERSQVAPEHLIGVCSDLARAFMSNPIFRHKIATHDLLSYALKSSNDHLTPIATEQLRRGEMMAPSSLIPIATADLLAQTFFDFVLKHNLAHTMVAMSAQQIQTIAIFLSHLQQKPAKRVHISERLDLIQQKPSYTPAEEIASPEIPHFVRLQSEADGAAEHAHLARPTMQAPVICQLCGTGVLTPKDLWAHAAKEHHSWLEARKRLIFEVQQRASVPLRPIEKRRHASNFMHDLLYSYPGRNTVRRDGCTMRQIVACSVCAIKDWIDGFYPCYMWKDPPALAVDDTSEGDANPSSDEEEEHRKAQLRGPQLRDDNGFCYFGPADDIHELLDVNLYVPVVPLAPLEELHASSVQHPRFHTMRWLLNTRRVPVLRGADAANSKERFDDSFECVSDDTVGGVAEHTKPSCAGIGDTDKPAWICHHCASHLRCRQPRMPPQALANWNWGGREHPKYQNLSMALKSLLCLVKVIMRMVLLKPTDNTDESEKALVGNTILVAQPSPAMVAAELPPTEAEQTAYFNVVYGGGASEHASSKLGKKKH
jgi:hypothetical protein